MKKTVMIVDDSAAMRQIVGITLGADYTVIEGKDGQDALNKLNGQKVHLIISDVNMPHMDGIAFVTELKRLSQYRFTPVIMLTTEFVESKRELGQRAGAKAWIVKPFQPEHLRSAVQRLCMP